MYIDYLYLKNINEIATDPSTLEINSEVFSYELNEGFKILHIEVNPTMIHPEFFVIDSLNQIHVFNIDFKKGLLYNSTVSSPINYYPYSAPS